MKVVLASDFEGVTCVTHWSQLIPGNVEAFRTAREHLTEDVNAAIRGLRKAGATEVLVIDGHAGGSPPNILDDFVIGGSVVPRGPSHHNAIDRTCDALALVGYHAMAGAQDGFLSHTVSGLTTALRINGRWIGETGINAGRAGAVGVPTVMAAGDAALAREATAFLPGVATATVKTASSRSEVTSLPRAEASRLIEEAAERGLRNRANCAPLTYSAPLTVDVQLLTVQQAEAAAILPRSERLDERTFRYHAETFGEAMQFFMSVVYLGHFVGARDTIAAYEKLPEVLAQKWQRSAARMEYFAVGPLPWTNQD